MRTYSKQIDDYIRGKLTPIEKKEFENELSTNPLLKKKVELCQDLHRSAMEGDIISLREKLNYSHIVYSKSKVRRIRAISLFAAASIALLFAFRFMLMDGSPNHEKIFREHFEPFQIIGETRTNQQDLTSLLPDEINKIYKKKEYHEVIPLLESYLEQYPNNKQAILMLSTAYIETNRNEKAEQILLELSFDSTKIIYNELTKWYLVLSILKQGKVDDAKVLLLEIKEEKGFYSDKAQSILNSL
jgi:hypothetical protein